MLFFSEAVEDFRVLECLLIQVSILLQNQSLSFININTKLKGKIDMFAI